MRAFEVLVNGEKLCVAGIGDGGVLSTIVNLVVHHGDGGFSVNVGGLISDTKEHVNWVSQKPLWETTFKSELLRQMQLTAPSINIALIPSLRLGTF